MWKMQTFKDLIKICRDKFWSSRDDKYALLEIIIITEIIIGLCFYFHPSDPFLLSGSFPWIWFAPVLVALRYGTFKGILSIVIITINWIFFKHANLTYILTAHYYFLGGFLLTVLSGEFQAVKAVQSKYNIELRDYFENRLRIITEELYLTKLSSDLMEQNFISTPLTIVGALEKVRTILIKSGGVFNKNTAEDLINLLNIFCDFKNAAIYAYRNGQFDIKPIAYIGNNISFNKDDILVKKCLDIKAPGYCAVNELTEYQQSQYLVTSLLRTSDNEIIGILVVEDMLFWYLTDETIKKINLVLTYFSDDFTSINQTKNFLALYPDCPLNFSKELHRLVNIKRAVGIDSGILVFAIKGERNDSVIMHLLENRYGLAMSWKYMEQGKKYLIILLPLLNFKTMAAYLLHMKQDLKREFGIYFENEEIFTFSSVITTDSPEENVRKLLQDYK